MSRKLRVQTVFFFYMWVCFVPKRPDLSDMFITALAVRTAAPPKCCLNTDIQSGENVLKVGFKWEILQWLVLDRRRREGRSTR